MNRRAFVSRLGAALAVAPVVASAKPAQRNELVPVSPGTVSQLCPGEDRRDCAPMTYGTCAECGHPIIQGQTWIAKPHYLPAGPVHEGCAKDMYKAQDRFSLLRSRGLIEPCPNCKVDAWKVTERDVVTCERCGWLDRRARFERPCHCPDCSWQREGHRALTRNVATVANDVWPPSMRSHLLDDAPIGFYTVVDCLQREVSRLERNVYSINTDGWLHNVQQRQLARVLCGVYALNNPKDRSGIEQVQRPNGDLVFFHWENVDCYEWQRDREQGV